MVVILGGTKRVCVICSGVSRRGPLGDLAGSLQPAANQGRAWGLCSHGRVAMAGGLRSRGPGLTIGQMRFDVPPAICFRGTGTNTPPPPPWLTLVSLTGPLPLPSRAGRRRATTSQQMVRKRRPVNGDGAPGWDWGLGSRRRGQQNSPTATGTCLPSATARAVCGRQHGGASPSLADGDSPFGSSAWSPGHSSCGSRWPGARGRRDVWWTYGTPASPCRSSAPPSQREMPCRRRWRCPMFRSLDRATGPQGHRHVQLPAARCPLVAVRPFR
ncbi:hypothetical protein QBC39DRAFT_109386 [Podospora conica]|nr:hypothetical protein QBC39DRAFT_109386 [Schizothecium conicum]